MAELIEEAYTKAVNVLKQNITELGFSASVEKSENYFSVWSRDHSICSLAAILTEDYNLVKTANKGVLTLLRYQIDSGQVPSYIEIENRKRVYGGLGAITSIDSNMWIVISSAILFKKTKDKRFIKKTNLDRYKKLYRLFKAFDSNDCDLIEVPKAGDWADIFNRTYHVLYDECLYYEALKSLQFLFENGLSFVEEDHYKKGIQKRIRWIKKRKARVKRKINSFFWFTKENIEKIREEYMIFEKIEPEDYDFYVSHLEPFKMTWQHQFDTFGNMLAILTGVANKEKSNAIIKHTLKNDVSNPFSIKSLDPPVYENDINWESIYATREQPYTYHNGGIWPMIAGFWIHALSKSKYSKHAHKELEKFAKAMKEDNYQFNEQYHGKTGKPLGKKLQAWSAAGYIIAYNSVKSNINLFNFY